MDKQEKTKSITQIAMPSYSRRYGGQKHSIALIEPQEMSEELDTHKDTKKS
jgi:hypothetical protein